FKSKRHKNTFTVPQSGKIEGDRISIPKFKGGIKVKLHREVEGKISKMTISRTPTGNYFVCIFTEQETQQFPKNNKAVGIDLGIKDFVITSDGKKFKNNCYTKKYASKLKKAQQNLYRKKKDSNGIEKQIRKTDKNHQKIANSRLDTLHKVSYRLVRDNQILVVEDLNVKGMKIGRASCRERVKKSREGVNIEEKT